MTKKQRIAIAKMWAAAMLTSSGMDSFDDEVHFEDAGDIVERVQAIGEKLLGSLPAISSLPEMIDYALNQTKDGTTNR